MEVSKALLERRTIRKFTQEKLNSQDLADLVEYARLAAYPANIQPLKFAVITEEKMVEKIFPETKWAGYLPDGTPKADERPVAYIAVFGDKELKKTFEVEAGAAITSMMLGAFDKGIASCWIGSLNRSRLMELFGLSEERFELVYILALGYPAQNSKVCDMTDGIKYFEDSDKVINVPKRPTSEILISVE